MKCKIFLTSVLILIAVFNIAIGISYLPIWAYVLIEIFSIFACIYLFVKNQHENQTNLEKKINLLSDLLNSYSAEIRSQIKEQNTILLETIVSNQKIITLKTSDVHDNLIKTIAETIKHTDENFNLTNSFIKAELDGQHEFISSLANNIKEKFSELSKKIDSENKETRVVLSNCTDRLNDSIDLKFKQVQEDLNESFINLKETSSTSTSQILKQINQANIAIQEGLRTTSSDIVSKTNSLSETLTLTYGEIKNQIESNENKITQLVTTGLDSVSSSLLVNINNVKQASYELTQQLLQSNKEHSESILQKGNSIQEIIDETTKDIISKTESLSKSLTMTSSELKESVENSGNKIAQLISTSLESVSSSISTNIDNIKQTSNESMQQLLLSNKEHSESILQKVDVAIQQSISIHEQINSTSSDIITKTEYLDKKLKINGDEIKDRLLDSDNKTTQLINEGFGNLSTSLSKIDTQTSAISTLIIKSIQDSDKATEEFMAGLLEQYQTIKKVLTSVQLKSHNIEEAVHVISQNESNLKIVDSILSHIKDLQSELKNTVSEINNQLLDTQISQETTNNELDKLQVLLRIVLKSFEEKINNFTNDLPKDVISSSEQDTKASSENVSKNSAEPSTITTLQTKNPNRTETIVDNETKNIVVNQYKDDIITKSTMKDTQGHTIYELEYVKGKIVRSRNYDRKGNINVEQTFYDNGQVHYRNEFTTKGKVTTEFDINGKKK